MDISLLLGADITPYHQRKRAFQLFNITSIEISKLFIFSVVNQKKSEVARDNC